MRHLLLTARLTGLGIMAASLISFASPLHWLAELFCHFTLQYFLGAVALGAVFLCLRRWGMAALMLAAALWHGWLLLPMMQPPPTPPPPFAPYDTVRVLHYNTLKTMPPDTHAEWILAQAETLDIVVVVEAIPGWEAFLPQLMQKFPYAAVELRPGAGGIMLLSKLPAEELRILDLGDDARPAALLRARTREHGYAFTLYAIHTRPPVLPAYAHTRNTLLLGAARAVGEDAAAHKILLGDFNITRWSPVYAEALALSGLRDSQDGLGIFHTSWPAWFPAPLRISIDHSWVSPHIAVLERQTGPALGSDHLPVTLMLSIPAIH